MKKTIKNRWPTKYSGSDAKLAKNKMLPKLAPKRKRFVALDGSDACTTKALIKGGISPSLIHLPNSNQGDYKALAKKYKNATHESMGEYLKRNKRVVHGGFDLDYMTFITGCKKAYSTPPQDLKTIFENGMICDKGVIALTLLVNFKKKSWSKEAHYQEVFEAMNIIGELAFKNGYHAIPQDKPGIYANLSTKIVEGKKKTIRGVMMYCLIFRIYRTYK